MANKKKDKEIKVEETVTIQCTCKNVHLGNGVVLKATQNKHGNWTDGDRAEVNPSVANQLIESGQCSKA